MYKKIIINNIITNYSVSEEGMIKNDSTGYILKINPRGTVQIRINGIGKAYTVGRLVAEAFLPKTDKSTLVWHIDQDVLNNKVENLKWITNTENT